MRGAAVVREAGAPSALDVMVASRRDERLTHTRRYVLGEVALYANGCVGACWAAIATLAAACHLSESTTRRALAELVDLGWLVELREVGRSTVYRICAERVRDPSAGRAPVEVEPQAQGDLFDGAHIPSPVQGGGVTRTDNQISDQTITDPPQPPRKRGGSTSPPEIDLEERPRPALPLETGDPERVEWVASFVAAELALVADEQSVEAARSSAEQFSRREGRIVDNLVALTRPIRAAGGRLVRRIPDAPDGLRRREIAAGMVVGARRWLGAVR